MANTMRVDVCYRPLRIGWVVRAGDMDAARQAIIYSHVIWGGRFNPIIVIDKEEEAKQLIKRFRVDILWPLDDCQETKNFLKKFPHLITPFHGDSIIVKSQWGDYANVLEITNALSHWHNKPEFKEIKEEGIHHYKWQPDDPLADVFLIQLGAYPNPDELGINYEEVLESYVPLIPYKLSPENNIPHDITAFANLASPSRFGLERHHSIRTSFDTPGFFIGNANDPDDLICHWNLRACDIPLWFVDPTYFDRYADMIPDWENFARSLIDHKTHEPDRKIGLWSRAYSGEAAGMFAGIDANIYPIDDSFWLRGRHAPMMYLGETSTLGVMGESNEIPRVNFSLPDKPFNSDPYFYHQQLVASISFFGALNKDEQHTFDAPFVPELNEFYARTMHFLHNKFRIEPGRLGLVIDASDHDSFLTAMPVESLIKEIFKMAGFDGKLSNSGRIVRQLITQLGGLQGARVFKIPGARELLKKAGPRETFLGQTAINTIADKKQGGFSTFSAHTDLYLCPRPHEAKLTPPDVFTYMVDKGLFRIGVDLTCTKCDMFSWIALDGLKKNITCELCGHSYDATRQLLDSKWKFRRSGVLGAERNAQGAIPVALTLQQLDTAFDSMFTKSMYSPSLDLTPTRDPTLPKCEVDFVWLLNGEQSSRTTVILAECKDKGPIRPEDFQRDVDNMRLVADAIPEDSFTTFVLFVKMADFSDEEIAMARTLNSKRKPRVILLTPRELEPYHIFERIEHKINARLYGGSPSELAEVTAHLYFT